MLTFVVLLLWRKSGLINLRIVRNPKLSTQTDYIHVKVFIYESYWSCATLGNH